MELLHSSVFFEVNGFITIIPENADRIYASFMLGKKTIDVIIPIEKINFNIHEGKEIRISHRRNFDGSKTVIIQEGHCV